MIDGLLSIVVPVYRVMPYLEQCVYSLLRQQYTYIEVILVDDGCPDGGGDLCDRLACEDGRIRVIHQANQGLSAARNAGLAEARGEFVSLIDSDDYVSEDYYISHIAYLMEHSEVDASFAGLVRVDEEGQTIEEQQTLATPVYHRGEPEMSDFFFSPQFSTLTQGIYRRRVWEEVSFPLGLLFEDTYVIPQLCDRLSVIRVSLQGTYYYRQRRGAITSTLTERHMKSLRQLFPVLLDYLAQANRRLYYDRLAVAKIFYKRHGLLLQAADRDDFLRMLRSYPINRRELLRLRGIKWTLKARLFFL